MCFISFGAIRFSPDDSNVYEFEVTVPSARPACEYRANPTHPLRRRCELATPSPLPAPHTRKAGRSPRSRTMSQARLKLRLAEGHAASSHPLGSPPPRPLER
eukprot:1189257-Prorocentrum_minimum.AAC.3